LWRAQSSQAQVVALAKVVIPAPFGRAMMMQSGGREEALGMGEMQI